MSQELLLCDPDGVPRAVQKVGVRSYDYGHETWVWWIDCIGRRHQRHAADVIAMLPCGLGLEFIEASSVGALEVVCRTILERFVDQWWTPPW